MLIFTEIGLGQGESTLTHTQFWWFDGTPEGNDDGDTTPESKADGDTTPEGKDDGDTTPEGNDDGDTTPEGKDDGDTTPEGNDDGDTTPEGKEIEDLLTSLGLSQVISEPTNFEPNKIPSGIDLIITGQPDLILNIGTRPSLDPYCHHQIIYCKVNFRIPPPPPFERKIWHFNRADSEAIKRSMASFPWQHLQHLNLNTNPNWQVKTFTDIFLSIILNFIPNETKKICSLVIHPE